MVDWAELDEWADRKRNKAREQLDKWVAEALDNSAGIDRLLAISDEEWQAAEEAMENAS